MFWISLDSTIKVALESMVGYFPSQSFSELPSGKKNCPALAWM